MKNIFRILVCVLAFVMVFSLCACAKDGSGDETKDPVNDTQNAEKDTTADTEEQNSPVQNNTAKFEVTVKDQDGNAVPAVMVQICKDACIPARTDENGVATFVIDEITSEHKLSVMSVPEGYSFDAEEIYLEDGMTEYTLEITKDAE